MVAGVDYSHARPDQQCMYNAGKRFVIRYVGTPSSGKNLTVSEANGLRNVKLDIGGVYETTAGFMLLGYDRGVRAAKEATTDAANYGYPSTRPLYYALDVDPRPLTTAQWDAVKAFCNGAASVTGKDRVGVYGGHLAIEKLVPNSATFGWQTYAWSAGLVSGKAHLYQYKNGVSLCGGTVDLCDSLKPDYGQWSLEDDMTPQELADAINTPNNAVRNAIRDLLEATKDNDAREIGVASWEDLLKILKDGAERTAGDIVVAQAVVEAGVEAVLAKVVADLTNLG